MGGAEEGKKGEARVDSATGVSGDTVEAIEPCRCDGAAGAAPYGDGTKTLLRGSTSGLSMLPAPNGCPLYAAGEANMAPPGEPNMLPALPLAEKCGGLICCARRRGEGQRWFDGRAKKGEGSAPGVAGTAAA